MALVNCPACKQSVSDLAAACPACGTKLAPTVGAAAKGPPPLPHGMPMPPPPAGSPAAAQSAPPGPVPSRYGGGQPAPAQGPYAPAPFAPGQYGNAPPPGGAPPFGGPPPLGAPPNYGGAPQYGAPQYGGMPYGQQPPFGGGVYGMYAPPLRPGSQLATWYTWLMLIGALAVGIGAGLIVYGVVNPKTTYSYSYGGYSGYGGYRTSYSHSYTRPDPDFVEPGTVILILGIFPALAAAVIFMCWLYQTWSAVPRQFRGSVTPGTAIGFLFIPLFNLVWVFFVVPGLSTALSRSLRAAKPNQNSSAGYGIGLTASILMIIPYISIIAPFFMIGWVNSANAAKNRLLSA